MMRVLHQVNTKIKRGAKEWLGKRYYTEARTRLKFWQQGLQGKQFVFVHTMGKVASSSIVRSLRASSAGPKLAIYHTHFLSTKGMTFAEGLADQGFAGPKVAPSDVRTFLIRSRILSRQLTNVFAGGGRIKLVTVVRDPVATNLSGFFYNNYSWPTLLRQAAQRREPHVLEDLLQHFLAAYPHEVPLNWFDLEMKEHFGLDIYAQPFQQERGYQILHGGQTELLVLKLDQLDICANVAFSAFLQIPQFSLLRVNEASDQWYAPLYRQFTSWVRLPAAYLDQLYDSRYTRHFYSEAEVANFRRRWSEGANVAVSGEQPANTVAAMPAFTQ